MKSSPLVSEASLQHAFDSGLERLLQHSSGLGAYILTLANASFDQRLWQRLATPLQARFESLTRRPQDAAAVDDRQVFQQLQAIGFEQLQRCQFRRAGPWELQFNPLRSFRPARMSQLPVSGLQAPFDGAAFNFSKPFLQPEIFWQGRLGGRHATLLYNKFPFVELHGLLVPDVTEGLPQFLRRRDHDYIWRLTGELAAGLPGIGFGYNSLGACASVNHLHFQLFHRHRALPVADPSWQHNGGRQAYPLPCLRLDSMTDAWQAIAALHQQQISYNLLYLPGRLYCLPRTRQGDYPHSSWAGGFAWYELAGGFTAFTRNAFENLQQRDIADELARLRPTET